MATGEGKKRRAGFLDRANGWVGRVFRPLASGKRFERCVLHIGTEKTGTSAIQRYLAQNRGELMRRGICYPELGEGGSQWEFVAAAHSMPWNDPGISRQFSISDPADQGAFRKRLREELQTQFSRATPCDTLIISSEHFHSRLTDAASIGRLKAFLDEWVDAYEVHVCFRRQDRVALSFNSTRIKSGGDDISHHLPGNISNVEKYYLYDEIFDLWAAAFGFGSMVPSLYDERNEILAQFCAGAGIPFDPRRAAGRVNRSLSTDGLMIAAYMNRHVYDPEIHSFEHRRRAVEIVSDRYVGKHFFVDRANAENFYALFDGVNARLKAAAFSHLDSPLFDDDFSEYPETVRSPGCSEDDIAVIATTIWDEAGRQIGANTVGRTLGQLSSLLR